MTAPTPPNLLLLHGENRHFVDRDIRDWLAAARDHCSSDLNIEVFDAPTRLDQVRRSLMEVPFLDDRRFVLVRDAPQMTERQRRGAEAASVLASAVEARAPTSALCLAVHGRVAATNPVVGVVRQLGGEVRQHELLRGRDLRVWVERRLQERGLRVPRGGIDHLLLATGGDPGVIEAEIDKLVASIDGPGALSVEQVRTLVGGEGQIEIWAVLERLLARPHARGAAAIVDLIAAGVSTQYLIATLAGQLRELLLAQEMLRERPGGATMLARELAIPPWRAERLARQAGAVSSEVVDRWLHQLQAVDAGMKAGTASDVDGLRSFALSAARMLQTVPARMASGSSP